MKKISVVVPTYNEEENIRLVAETITCIMREELGKYDYEMIFIDNASTDQSRKLIRSVCADNERVKAIFNSANFGWMRSPIYGAMQSDGDCTILMPADMQDPPALIPQFVKAWEEGYKVVVGVKKWSKENPLVYQFRSWYYRFIDHFSDVRQISQFTGFGLYDRQFIEALRSLDDPMPYIKGIVAELGFKRKEIAYTQEKRKAGEAKGNFWKLYDVAMLGITSNTKMPMRLATIVGFLFSAVSIIIALVFLILKLTHWMSFPMGMAPLLIGVFFLGGIQLFFIGLIGEYIMTINARVIHRPLVIEEERINFGG